MIFESFKRILIKSNNKILITGIVIFITGALMAVGSLFADNNTAGWVISSIFIALGLLILVRSLAAINQIKSDELPLLKAIKNQESDFMVWIYIKEIVGKVEGVKVSKSNNVVICSKDNKHIEIVLSKKEDPEALIAYLLTLFPAALVGFTDENKIAADQIWKPAKNNFKQ